MTAADLGTRPLDPVRDRPLGPQEVAALRAEFARWAGLPPGAVIAFPFASLAPIPRPVRCRPDGTGRLPRRITPAGGRHPAWWLDAGTAHRDPDESLLAYGVRLALDLAARGLLGSDGEPLDALARSGLVAGEAADQRLRRYAAGARDPLLGRLALPAPEPARPSRARCRAEAEAWLARRLGVAPARPGLDGMDLPEVPQLSPVRPHGS